MVPPAQGDDTTKRLRVSTFSTRAHRELKVGCESEEGGEGGRGERKGEGGRGEGEEGEGTEGGEGG